MNNFTEVSETGFLDNIGNSLKGIIFGLIMVIGSIVLLWWNEGRSVDQTDALNEMKTKVTTISDSKYNSELDGKAISLQGEVIPIYKLSDPLFNVESDSLVLKREVKMYQWKENKSTKDEKKMGGGTTTTTTTYDYVNVWSEDKIDSSTFKHINGHTNPTMNYKSETFTASAKMGDYSLDTQVIAHIVPKKVYNGLSDLPEEIGEAKNHKTFLYIGENADLPTIGDIKITYFYAPSDTYTFVGKQFAKNLINYTTKNGKHLLFVREGRVSSEQIFKEELDANALLTWSLRGGGLLIMFLGFMMAFSIIPTLANVIPIFGSIVGAGTGIVAGILTLILGSTTIALAWFTSRPLLAVGVLIIGFGIAFALAKFTKKEKKKIKK